MIIRITPSNNISISQVSCHESGYALGHRYRDGDQAGDVAADIGDGNISLAGPHSGNQTAGGNRGDLYVIDDKGAFRGDVLSRAALKRGRDKELVGTASGECNNLFVVGY